MRKKMQNTAMEEVRTTKTTTFEEAGGKDADGSYGTRITTITIEKWFKPILDSQIREGEQNYTDTLTRILRERDDYRMEALRSSSLFEASKAREMTLRKRLRGQWVEGGR